MTNSSDVTKSLITKTHIFNKVSGALTPIQLCLSLLKEIYFFINKPTIMCDKAISAH